jgi:N,N'-diacetyllegionaminate synthase
MKQKVTIIAEACQNHKGDLSILKDMIWSAKEAGADYIKIQSMLADELTNRPQFEEGKTENGQIKAIKRPYAPEYARLKPMDLDDKAHVFFAEECRKAGIKPMTTPFTHGRVDFLKTLGWDAVKVASYDCGSLPLLRRLKASFGHVYISTGATTDEEIAQAAKLLAGQSFTFLHCVTIYPTPLNEIHLRRMDWLRQFTQSVGFSDHTLVARDGLKASLAAIYYGADVIERHFTVLPADATKDGPVSITPDHIKQLRTFADSSKEEQKSYIEKHVPEYKDMLGVPTRNLGAAELLNRDYYRGRFAYHKNGEVIYNWQEVKNDK